jgi:Holliday junction DNA helicase RuvA
MYAFIKGRVALRTAQTVVIDCQGVGYDIITPHPFDFTIDETVLLYVYHHVREDASLLYGFRSNDDKALFIKLLGVKGIGPKSALAILASGHTKDVIHAIEVGNAKFLTNFPGIGPKASQQIILDLKGKLITETTVKQSTSLMEVEDALKSLGYKAKEIKKALKTLDGSKTTEVLIREALGKMIQK